MGEKEIKDSGQRTEYANGFVRDMHEGKGRFDLIPWYAIWELAKHCEAGAKKYGERNIDLGCPQHSLIDSAIRHLAKYLMGWDDEDHLRAALWNIAWAVQQDVIMPEMQDIPARMGKKTQEKTLKDAMAEITDWMKENTPNLCDDGASCGVARKRWLEEGVSDETCKD